MKIAVLTDHRGVEFIAVSAQLVCLIGFPFVVYSFSGSVPYIKTCPSQYSKVVLSIFMAGILATGFSYVRSLLLDKELKGLAKAALIGGVIPIAAIAFALGQGSFGESKLDLLSLFTAILAAFGAIASFIQSWPWGTAAEDRKQMFLFIDLPVVFVCFAMVVFKYQFYDWSTEEYNSLVAATFPHAPYRTPEFQRFLEEYLSLVRNSFWVGFSAGVVTVQLIVSQIIDIVLRSRYLLHKLRSP